MKVDFRECFGYAAWIVSSHFGTQTAYRVYIRVLDPGRSKVTPELGNRSPNWFANKHLGDDPAAVLRKRTFNGVTEAEKWDALERYGVKLKPDLSPKNPPSTNTVIDFDKIDKKLVAYLFAKALFEGMVAGKFGDYRTAKASAYVNHFEVDFDGIPCVVSAGNMAGIASRIQVGVKRVSTLNAQNQVSFEVNHCAGAVGTPVSQHP